MMRTSQICESMNAYLKYFVDCHLKMFEFVTQIDKAVKRLSHVETYDDFIDFDGTPKLTIYLRDIKK